MTLTDEQLLEDLENFIEETGETSSSKYNEIWNGHAAKTFYSHFGSWQEALELVGVETESVECPHPDCGIRFFTIGNHWNRYPNHRPEITQRQHEILTGLLMGDGTASRREKNVYLMCGMTTPEFLEWVDDEMGIMGTGVKDGISAKEQAEKHRKTGFNPNAKEENLSDQFVWNSRCHPELNQYLGWYSTGKKRYPDDLELTPLILKVWYCCDGGKIKTDGDGARIGISCNNEYDREDFIVSLFENSELETTPTIQKTERRSGRKEMTIKFDIPNSKTVWDWMGEPIPGFEYKWPTEEEYRTNPRWWTEEEEEILRKKYPEEGGYIDELDWGREKINQKAARMGIKYDPQRKYKDKEWLEEKYWEEGYRIQEIADMFDLNYASMWEWFDKLDVERREPGIN